MALSSAVYFLAALLTIHIEPSYCCPQREINDCMAKFSEGDINTDLSVICQNFERGKMCLHNLMDTCANDMLKKSLSTLLQTVRKKIGTICDEVSGNRESSDKEKEHEGNQGHESHSNSRSNTPNGHKTTCDIGSMATCFEGSNSNDMKVRCGGYTEYMSCYNAWKSKCWDQIPVVSKSTAIVEIERVAEEAKKECIALGYSLGEDSDDLEFNSDNQAGGDSNDGESKSDNQGGDNSRGDSDDSKSKSYNQGGDDGRGDSNDSKSKSYSKGGDDGREDSDGTNSNSANQGGDDDRGDTDNSKYKSYNQRGGDSDGSKFDSTNKGVDDSNAASALSPMNLFMMVASILLAAFSQN